MKLLVATLSIALVNSAQAAASKDSVPLAKTTSIPVVGEYLKNKARDMSTEALVGDLNRNEQSLSPKQMMKEVVNEFLTPQHLIDELMARATKPETFESVVTAFTSERSRNGSNGGNFRETNKKVLELRDPVPSNLDAEGVVKLYKAACAGLEVPDCYKFATTLFEKNYANLAPSSLAELVVLNAGKLGTANQELPSSLCLKIGEQILLKDPVVDDLFNMIPVFTELARFDGPGRGRNNPGLKQPATYQDKGAPHLKVRDKLLQMAFEKNPTETVRFAGDSLVSDFETIASSTPGELGKSSLTALATEQKPLITLFAKNAGEALFADFKNQVEAISQKPMAKEVIPGWRERNRKLWMATIEAAQATH